MIRKDRPPGGHSRGSEVSHRHGASTAAIVPRQADHENADHENAERQTRARARLAVQDRRLRIARWAHREMPLTVHYAHPRGGWYCPIVEGWPWAS